MFRMRGVVEQILGCVCEQPLSSLFSLNSISLLLSQQLQNEDLLISAASGEPPLFTDAPVSQWLRLLGR